MTCNCIAEMDAVLAEHNGRISATICFPRTDAINLGQPYDTVTIGVEKIASRGKRPPLAAPTFCPFCGERYVAPASAGEARQGRGAQRLDPKDDHATAQPGRPALPQTTLSPALADDPRRDAEGRR